MKPKFRVYMSDASNNDAWGEIHGSNGEYTKENTLIKPKLDLEVNNAGKFEFTLPECHNQYSWPKVDKTMVEVYELTPNISTQTTQLYFSDDKRYNIAETVYEVNNPASPDFVNVFIGYPDYTAGQSSQAMAAMQQKFSVTHKCDGVVRDVKYIQCQTQRPSSRRFLYAFHLVTGALNSFVIESCSAATVCPTIELYSERTVSDPIYKSIFYGRVSQVDVDFYKNKVVKCEGALAFLNDVVIRTEKYGTPDTDEGSTTPLSSFVDTFFSYYNKGGGASDGDSVAIADRLKMGTVTYQNGAVTSSKYVYRNVSYEKAFDVFSKKIIGAEGGYFLMNRDNLNANGSHPSNTGGTRWKYILPGVNDPYPANKHEEVLDWNYKAKASYSVNLTDLKKTEIIDDIVTTVIPIGHWQSDDVTIKNSEYLNRKFKIYDNYNGSVIYDGNTYMGCSNETTLYFAVYDTIGGCRIWARSDPDNTGSTANEKKVTLFWYRGLKVDWDADRNAGETGRSLFNRSVSTEDNSDNKGDGSPYSGDLRTVYGWNYFAIKPSDSTVQGTKKIKISRIDRDAQDSNNKYLLDYIQDPDLAAIYGNKSKVVEFGDIDSKTKSGLKKKLMTAGVEWLNQQIYIPDSLEVNAVDMTYLARNGENGHYPFQLGEAVHVYSNPHGVSKDMAITKLTIDMDSAKTEVTLGTPQIPTLTEYYRTKKKGEYTKEYVINDNV